MKGTARSKKTTRAKGKGRRRKASAAASSKRPPTISEPPEEMIAHGWDELKTGSIVLAQDNPTDGWWEAVVKDVNGDVLTLRWRGYPGLAAVNRHREQIGFFAAPR